ncbi:hypothetical protein OG455_00350 [Kitasatospora sp. NBC_01287]|uniref:hypothetical protein n=1 Tax=Kitasatospora sp. NBC_01287 TaxID=2903573 RepID=UPI002251C939|nr:hypothetical protein [Kitasatospora sp. NBC_01287]MCX4743976.1 hypothetical protein [Kitasatospora sp. NBC_01287]
MRNEALVMAWKNPRGRHEAASSHPAGEIRLTRAATAATVGRRAQLLARPAGPAMAECPILYPTCTITGPMAV